MELLGSDFRSQECKAFAYLRAVVTFSRDQTALNAEVWVPWGSALMTIKMSPSLSFGLFEDRRVELVCRLQGQGLGLGLGRMVWVPSAGVRVSDRLNNFRNSGGFFQLNVVTPDTHSQMSLGPINTVLDRNLWVEE